jgi:hypothetical protein
MKKNPKEINLNKFNKDPFVYIGWSDYGESEEESTQTKSKDNPVIEVKNGNRNGTFEKEKLIGKKRKNLDDENNNIILDKNLLLKSQPNLLSKSELPPANHKNGKVNLPCVKSEDMSDENIKKPSPVKKLEVKSIRDKIKEETNQRKKKEFKEKQPPVIKQREYAAYEMNIFNNDITKDLIIPKKEEIRTRNILQVLFNY